MKVTLATILIFLRTYFLIIVPSLLLIFSSCDVNQPVEQADLNQLSTLSMDSLEILLSKSEGGERVNLLHTIVRRKWLSNPLDAKELGYEALELSQTLKSEYLISSSYRFLAGVYYYLGDFETSYEFNVTALEIATNLGDSTLINNGLNNIGLLYLDLSSTEAAMEYLLRSKEMKESINAAYGLATTINNIGLAYAKAIEYEEAINSFRQALGIAINTNDYDNQVYSFNNLGNVNIELGNLSRAYELFRKSSLLADTIPNVNWGAIAVRGKGKVKLMNKELDSADYFFRKSLLMSTSIEDKKGMSESYYWLAKSSLKKLRTDSVIYYLDKSDLLANKIKSGIQIIENLSLYIEFYDQNLQLEKAHNLQKKYSYLKDSLFQDAVARNIRLLPLKLRAEKNIVKLGSQKNELAIRKSRNTIYLIVLLLLIPSVIVLVVVTRKLRKANNRISEQNEEYKTSYETVKLLSTIGADIIATLSLESIIHRVYENVKKLLPADSFYFGLYNQKKNALVFTGNIEKGEKSEDFIYDLNEDSYRLAVQCFKIQDTLLTNKFRVDYPMYPYSVKGKPIQSVLMVPLFVEKRPLGVISVESFSENAYSNYHVGILKNLAVFVSIAIENAQTFEKLEASYDQLKELDEFKESMTAMIVHDFKNSLNTVINFSEGKATERRMKGIRQAGQFMLNMVMNILDVQKFEETNPKLSLANYPISRLIKHATEQLTYMMDQKSIKLEVCQDKAFEVRIDHDLIVRVIVNILSNAIKYSPQNGQIAISISKSNQGELVNVSIQDQGPGIPLDKLETVFDKYAQVEARKEGIARSTGLGLTFCKMVVEAHMGSIWVESENQKGSKFYFTVPLVKGLEGEPIEAIDWEHDQSILLTKNEKKSILNHLEDLSHWEVYDYSDVLEILNRIESESENICDWKEQMMKALHNGNEELFKSLINQ